MGTCGHSIGNLDYQFPSRLQDAPDLLNGCWRIDHVLQGMLDCHDVKKVTG